MSSSCCKRIKLSSESDSLTTNSVGETSSSSTLSAIENERLQQVAQNADVHFFPSTTALEYSSGLPLQPEELLLYSLIKISVPGNNINSVKGYSPEKFGGVSNAVWDVYGIHFDCVSLRNYFYRSITNSTKGLGKFKGILRWKYFHLNIDDTIKKHQQVLINLLINNHEVSAQDYKNLRDALSTASVSVAQQLSKSDSLACKVNGRIDTISRRFPKWKVAANVTKSEVYLHYFGNNLANTEYQVTVLADGSYKFIVGGRPRQIKINHEEYKNMSNPIHSLSDLYLFIEQLESCCICPGVLASEYDDQIQGINGCDIPVYKTVAGEPAAYVERLPSNLEVKIIRSTKCPLIAKAGARCEACVQVNHYMRTIKSRNKNKNVESMTKFARFDYLTKEDLVEKSRHMAEQIHKLETRVKRLKEHQDTMSTVGQVTDADFRMLFDQLSTGLKKVKEKHCDNTCYWKDCSCENEFESKDLLMKHIRTCHMKTMCDVPPIERAYTCEWLCCMKGFSKKHLLDNHIIEHIGSESDLFLITLLKDQAKARKLLNVAVIDLRRGYLVGTLSMFLR